MPYPTNGGGSSGSGTGGASHIRSLSWSPPNLTITPSTGSAVVINIADVLEASPAVLNDIRAASLVTVNNAQVIRFVYRRYGSTNDEHVDLPLPDLSDYSTTAEITRVLASYVTTAALTTALRGYVTRLSANSTGLTYHLASGDERLSLQQPIDYYMSRDSGMHTLQAKVAPITLPSDSTWTTFTPASSTFEFDVLTPQLTETIAQQLTRATFNNPASVQSGVIVSGASPDVPFNIFLKANKTSTVDLLNLRLRVTTTDALSNATTVHVFYAANETTSVVRSDTTHNYYHLNFYDELSERTGDVSFVAIGGGTVSNPVRITYNMVIESTSGAWLFDGNIGWDNITSKPTRLTRNPVVSNSGNTLTMNIDGETSPVTFTPMTGSSSGGVPDDGSITEVKLADTVRDLIREEDIAESTSIGALPAWALSANNAGAALHFTLASVADLTSTSILTAGFVRSASVTSNAQVKLYLRVTKASSIALQRRGLGFSTVQTTLTPTYATSNQVTKRLETLHFNRLHKIETTSTTYDFYKVSLTRSGTELFTNTHSTSIYAVCLTAATGYGAQFEGNLKDGSVQTSHLQDSAVTSSKIADGTIVYGDLSTDVQGRFTVADHAEVFRDLRETVFQIRALDETIEVNGTWVNVDDTTLIAFATSTSQMNSLAQFQSVQNWRSSVSVGADMYISIRLTNAFVSLLASLTPAQTILSENFVIRITTSQGNLDLPVSITGAHNETDFSYYYYTIRNTLFSLEHPSLIFTQMFGANVTIRMARNTNANPLQRLAPDTQAVASDTTLTGTGITASPLAIDQRLEYDRTVESRAIKNILARLSALQQIEDPITDSGFSLTAPTGTSMQLSIWQPSAFPANESARVVATLTLTQAMGLTYMNTVSPTAGRYGILVARITTPTTNRPITRYASYGKGGRFSRTYGEDFISLGASGGFTYYLIPEGNNRIRALLSDQIGLIYSASNNAMHRLRAALSWDYLTNIPSDIPRNLAISSGNLTFTRTDGTARSLALPTGGGGTAFNESYVSNIENTYTAGTAGTTPAELAISKRTGTGAAATTRLDMRSIVHAINESDHTALHFKSLLQASSAVNATTIYDALPTTPEFSRLGFALVEASSSQLAEPSRLPWDAQNKLDISTLTFQQTLNLGTAHLNKCFYIIYRITTTNNVLLKSLPLNYTTPFDVSFTTIRPIISNPITATNATNLVANDRYWVISLGHITNRNDDFVYCFPVLGRLTMLLQRTGSPLFPPLLNLNANVPVENITGLDTTITSLRGRLSVLDDKTASLSAVEAAATPIRETDKTIAAFNLVASSSPSTLTAVRALAESAWSAERLVSSQLVPQQIRFRLRRSSTDANVLRQRLELFSCIIDFLTTQRSNIEIENDTMRLLGNSTDGNYAYYIYDVTPTDSLGSSTISIDRSAVIRCRRHATRRYSEFPVNDLIAGNGADPNNIVTKLEFNTSDNMLRVQNLSDVQFNSSGINRAADATQWTGNAVDLSSLAGGGSASVIGTGDSQFTQTEFNNIKKYGRVNPTQIKVPNPYLAVWGVTPPTTSSVPTATPYVLTGTIITNAGGIYYGWIPTHYVRNKQSSNITFNRIGTRATPIPVATRRWVTDVDHDDFVSQSISLSSAIGGYTGWAQVQIQYRDNANPLVAGDTIEFDLPAWQEETGAELQQFENEVRPTLDRLPLTTDYTFPSSFRIYEGQTLSSATAITGSDHANGRQFVITAASAAQASAGLKYWIPVDHVERVGRHFTVVRGLAGDATEDLPVVASLLNYGTRSSIIYYEINIPSRQVTAGNKFTLFVPSQNLRVNAELAQLEARTVINQPSEIVIQGVAADDIINRTTFSTTGVQLEWTPPDGWREAWFHVVLTHSSADHSILFQFYWSKAGLDAFRHLRPAQTLIYIAQSVGTTNHLMYYRTTDNVFAAYDNSNNPTQRSRIISVNYR